MDELEIHERESPLGNSLLQNSSRQELRSELVIEGEEVRGQGQSGAHIDRDEAIQDMYQETKVEMVSYLSYFLQFVIYSPI